MSPVGYASDNSRVSQNRFQHDFFDDDIRTVRCLLPMVYQMSLSQIKPLRSNLLNFNYFSTIRFVTSLYLLTTQPQMDKLNVWCKRRNNSFLKWQKSKPRWLVFCYNT